MAALATPHYDAQLMLQIQAGDQTSFDLLLARYRAPVIGFLYRMVQNQAVAEELAQEVFFRVYRARARYQPTAKFSTWLFRIAAHRALNWLRDVRKERGHESLEGTAGAAPTRQISDHRLNVEQALLYRHRVDEIRQAVRNLPERQRAAVLMHKYQEMDYSQIAQALECSESAVKSLLFRAYEDLRRSLVHMGPPRRRHTAVC